MSEADDILAHYGVKGMRWGVRNSQTVQKSDKGAKLVLTKQFTSGDSVSIYEQPPSSLQKVLGALGKDTTKFKAFKLTDKNGKKVGDASFRRKSKEELYLNWIGIKPKHRGKGYASAALKGALKYAESEGIKKLKLDVPGNAPDARHIYEKLGFKDDGEMTGSKTDIWGGLYPMSMSVDETKHAGMTSSEKWEEQFAEEFAQFLIDNFGSSEEEVKQMVTVENFLAHYGVKGMRWGRTKTDVGASGDARASAAARDKAKGDKQGVKVLSNVELQAAINRMQLEQNFKRLAVNERPPVQRWIASTLLEIGKREVQVALGKKIASTVAKKIATGGAA